MKSSLNGSNGHHQFPETSSSTAALDLTRQQAILEDYHRKTGIIVQLADISSYSRGKVVNAVGTFLQVLDDNTGSIKELARNSLTEQFSPGLANLKSGHQVEIISLPLDLVGDGTVQIKRLFDQAGLKTDRNWDLVFPAPIEIVAANQSSPVQNHPSATASIEAVSNTPKATDNAAE